MKSGNGAPARMNGPIDYKSIALPTELQGQNVYVT